MPRRCVQALLIATLIATIGLMLLAASPVPGPAVDAVQGASDSATYFDIVSRMRAGAGYYAAAHQALMAGGYGTTSVFNWRTPAWPELLAHLPSFLWAQTLLSGLAMAAMLLTYRRVRQDGGPIMAIATVLALSANLIALTVRSSIVFTEVSAGTLILFSLSAYGNGLRLLGAAGAITALFLRELAGPYLVICIGLALREKQRKELSLLIAGLIVYVAYFAWHWVMVKHQLGPADRAYSSGWLQFGGLRFMLATAQFNGVFSTIALPWTALLLPVSLLGFVAWPNGNRPGLFVATYLIAFTIVGKPFNNYWGALYTPVMMLGLAWGCLAVRNGLFPKAGPGTVISPG